MQLNEKQTALAEDLRAMLKRTHTSETMLVVGFAGTGKTATLAHVLSERDDVVYLTPSHKAKNVLREALPNAAIHTLHRALAWRHKWHGTSEYYAPSANHDEPLRTYLGADKRIVVLDECSMVGGAMFEHLLRVLGLDDAERKGAQVLIERHVNLGMMDQHSASEALRTLYDLKRCPQDGSTVFGRPRSTSPGCYTYHVEGDRVPVKLIVMGDPAQLPPVIAPVPCASALALVSPETAWLLRTDNARINQRGFIESALAYSPTFLHKYDHRHDLKQLMRAQHEDLARHNLEARRAAMRDYTHRISAWSEHVEVVDHERFVDEAVEAYKRQENAVVLTFRNVTCRDLNDKVRAGLLGSKRDRSTLHVGEPCDLCSPLRDPVLMSEMDNGDLVYVERVEPGVVYPFSALPGADMTPLHCQRITIKRARDGRLGVAYWLDQEQARTVARMRDAIDAQLDTLEQPSTKKTTDTETLARAERIRDLQARGRALRTTFTDLRPAYVKTIHKAQGGTWDRVFFAQHDLRSDMAPRLAYVAISRARHCLTIC